MERPEQPGRGVTSGDPLSGARPSGDEASAPTPPPAAWLPPVPASGPGSRPLAEWWRRLAALLLDGLIVGVVAGALIAAITAAAGGVGFLGGEETGFAGLVVGLVFSTLVVTIVALLYAPALMARTNGRTLGKQALGIRVVRVDGQPTTFGWSVLREVVLKQLVFVGVLGGATFGLAWLLDGLWALWDGERRALHDFPVDSRVVRD